MEALVDANHVAEKRDAYMLQYILKSKNMLSTTSFKVLQSQSDAGLLPCYRVIFNGRDKLDYDIEPYVDLSSQLPVMDAALFLQYVRIIFEIIMKLGNTGFLHPMNLETSLDKIFIDSRTYKLYMVYLPVGDAYLQYMNKAYLQALKMSLLVAIQENENLQDPVSRGLCLLLRDSASTLEQLIAPLEELAPLQPPQSGGLPTGAMPATGTGQMQRRPSGELDGIENLLPSAALPEQPAEPAGKNAKQRLRRFLFGGKKASAEQPVAQEFGMTEVLDELFVPNIVLIGTEPKDEILVRKREFVLGKLAERTDHAIGYSNAVSRIHCKITCNDGRNFISDLGSANGTYVNGQRLEKEVPFPLNQGDKIKLGNVNFVVRDV